MPKKFEITGLNGERFYEGSASHWAEFRNELFSICGAGVVDQGLYFVAGREVDFPSALTAANEAEEVFLRKRSETHRPIRVHHGASSCNNTFHTVWVRK